MWEEKKKEGKNERRSERSKYGGKVMGVGK